MKIGKGSGSSSGMNQASALAGSRRAAHVPRSHFRDAHSRGMRFALFGGGCSGFPLACVASNSQEKGQTNAPTCNPSQ